jgi:hypothetical protein
MLILFELENPEAGLKVLNNPLIRRCYKRQLASGAVFPVC